MAITLTQQRGLANCPDFVTQVNGIVEYQTLEYVKQYQDVMTPNDRDVLSRVQHQANAYGFVSTILSDGNWSLTFDAWEADTAAAGSLILTAVQTWYYFCTGFKPPEPQVLVQGAAAEESGQPFSAQGSPP